MTLDWENDPELRAIRKDFCDSLADRRRLLAQVISALRDGRCEPQTLERLQSIAHKLAGTAESYGFPTLTRICEALDDFLDAAGPSAEAGRILEFAMLADDAIAASQGGDDPSAFETDARMRKLISAVGSPLSGAKRESS